MTLHECPGETVENFTSCISHMLPDQQEEADGPMYPQMCVSPLMNVSFDGTSPVNTMIPNQLDNPPEMMQDISLHSNGANVEEKPSTASIPQGDNGTIDASEPLRCGPNLEMLDTIMDDNSLAEKSMDSPASRKSIPGYIEDIANQVGELIRQIVSPKKSTQSDDDGLDKDETTLTSPEESHVAHVGEKDQDLSESNVCNAADILITNDLALEREDMTNEEEKISTQECSKEPFENKMDHGNEFLDDEMSAKSQDQRTGDITTTNEDSLSTESSIYPNTSAEQVDIGLGQGTNDLALEREDMTNEEEKISTQECSKEPFENTMDNGNEFLDDEMSAKSQDRKTGGITTTNDDSLATVSSIYPNASAEVEIIPEISSSMKQVDTGLVQADRSQIDIPGLSGMCAMMSHVDISRDGTSLLNAPTIDLEGKNMNVCDQVPTPSFRNCDTKNVDISREHQYDDEDDKNVSTQKRYETSPMALSADDISYDDISCDESSEGTITSSNTRHNRCITKESVSSQNGQDRKEKRSDAEAKRLSHGPRLSRVTSEDVSTASSSCTSSPEKRSEEKRRISENNPRYESVIAIASASACFDRLANQESVVSSERMKEGEQLGSPTGEKKSTHKTSAVPRSSSKTSNRDQTPRTISEQSNARSSDDQSVTGTSASSWHLRLASHETVSSQLMREQRAKSPLSKVGNVTTKLSDDYSLATDTVGSTTSYGTWHHRLAHHDTEASKGRKILVDNHSGSKTPTRESLRSPSSKLSDDRSVTSEAYWTWHRLANHDTVSSRLKREQREKSPYNSSLHHQHGKLDDHSVDVETVGSTTSCSTWHHRLAYHETEASKSRKIFVDNHSNLKTPTKDSLCSPSQSLKRSSTPRAAHLHAKIKLCINIACRSAFSEKRLVSLLDGFILREQEMVEDRETREPMEIAERV